MENSSVNITSTLNAVMNAVEIVIPIPSNRNHPELFIPPLNQTGVGVLIGITGDVRGRLIVTAEHSVFTSVALKMFGMAIEGSMLESFIGELGNMIGGNMCTQVSSLGVNLDISPPTVLVGDVKLTGFSKGLKIPVDISGVGKLDILLILEDAQK